MTQKAISEKRSDDINPKLIICACVTGSVETFIYFDFSRSINSPPINKRQGNLKTYSELI